MRPRCFGVLSVLITQTLFAITTFDTSSLYQINTAGGIFSGVAQLTGSIGGCSASLIADSFVLTAAHCLQGNIHVTFSAASGAPVYTAINQVAHPLYGGSGNPINDIAIVQLNTAADPSIMRYGLYRFSDEFTQVATLAGYGYGGQGQFTSGSGLPRAGLNQIDAFWDGTTKTNFVGGVQYTLANVNNALAFDFDGGLNNFLGDTGLIGAGFTAPGNEAFVCYGDSGGPSFAGNQFSSPSGTPLIIGVHDFIDDLLATGPNPPQPNCGFGNLGGDARVSVFAPWIDSTIAGLSTPEPATWILTSAGIALLCLRRRGQN